MVYGENIKDGQQVFYTKKDKTVYAILLGWPGDNKTILFNELTKSNLKTTVKSVTLLGLKQLEKCPFAVEDALSVTIPAKTRKPSDIAQVFRIELE